MEAAGLYWVPGPWPGRLALAARPRGGDWLSNEFAAWQREGIQAVVSLLESEEARELELAAEEQEALAHGMKFLSLPIEDRQVPRSEKKCSALLDDVDRELGAGNNVVVHCRQGIGRTGLVAACLLVNQGLDPISAIRRLSEARGVEMPDTEEQMQWITKFAGSALSAR